MASTYTTRLKLERQASGENSGNWGNLTNFVLNRIDSTVRGYKAVSVAGSANVTLVSNTSTTNTAEAADDQVHNKVIEFTGALTGAITVFTDAVEGDYTLFNNTSGSHVLKFANTGHASNGVAITQGTKSIVYSNGSTIFDVGADLGAVGVNSLTSTGNVNLTAASSLVLQDTTGGQFAALKANTATTSYTLTLPPATGTANQVMATDGSGNLSFTDVSGGVDWQTTVKTGDFTAASGKGYFVNTTSGEVDVTLPGSPSAGDIVAIKDYANKFSINNCIMLRNGSNISGGAFNGTLSTEGVSITLLYIDGTRGWLVTDNGSEATSGTGAFISATGGTITEEGNFKIHTFTGPGTFAVSAVGNAAGSDSVDYLLIAGGGGGGGANSPGGSPYGSGGGGGAGGYRESPGTASGSYSVSPRGVSPAAAIPVSASPGSYPIAVGGGAATSPAFARGANGSNSTGLGLTSSGGGGAGFQQTGAGLAGGSGGGATAAGNGGAGNTPPVAPVQGTAGGNAAGSQAGGGGGATAVGVNGVPGGGGNGGAGGTSAINSINTQRAGGGGGGTYGPSKPSGTGVGGGGPGGPGPGSTAQGNGQAGTANTGGGGGGGSTLGPNAGPSNGGAAGSGLVIIRYKFQ